MRLMSKFNLDKIKYVTMEDGEEVYEVKLKAYLTKSELKKFLELKTKCDCEKCVLNCNERDNNERKGKS